MFIVSAVRGEALSEGRSVERVQDVSADRGLETVPRLVHQGRLCEADQRFRLYNDLGTGAQLCRAWSPRRLDEGRAAGHLLSK